MAGAKLATAYYELIASTPGAQQQIARGLIPAAQKAGGEASKSLADALGRGAEEGGASAGGRSGRSFGSALQSATSGLGSIGSNIGHAVGTGLTAAATAAVSGGAAVLGTALTSGFNRLNAIDTAKAKLKGLGNDAQAVEAIMKNATAAVKGTAFGLDAAATVAASAVASGIQPGEQLQGVLSTIANVAAAAGTSMDEMGAIFNKAAGAGRADTEVMNQLADRGIPIWQKLADQYGTTAVGVRKMASDGKISFEDFSAAAASAAGTVATEMGNTVPGAISNLKASIGRVGANLLSGLFPNITPLVQSITSAIGPLETAAKGVGSSLGENLSPAIETVSRLITSLTDGTNNLGSIFSGLGGIIGPVTGAFAALGTGGLATLAAKIPFLSGALPGLGAAARALTGPIGILVSAFIGLAATSPQLQGALAGLSNGVFSALRDVASQLAPIFSQLTPVLQQLSETIAGALAVAIEQLTPVITMLVPIIGQIITLLAGAVVQILPIISQVIAALMPVLTAIITSLSQLIGAILPPLMGIISQLMPVIIQIVSVLSGVLMAVLPVITTIIQALTPVLTAIINVLMQIISAILPPLISLIQAVMPVIESLMPIFTQLVAAIQPIITLAAQLIADILPPLASGFTAIIGPAMSLVATIVSAVIPVVQLLMSNLTGVITFVKNVFTGDWSAAWEQIKGWVHTAVDGIKGFIDGMLDWFRDIPSKIKDFFADAPNLLKSAGKNIIDGFLNGLKGAFESVKDFVGSIGDWIADHKGPKAYDLALLVPAGGWIMAGLQEGLRSAMPDLTRTIEHITSGLQNDFEIGARVTSRGLSRPTAGGLDSYTLQPGSHSPTINITNHYPTAQPEWKERNDVAQGIRLALA